MSEAGIDLVLALHSHLPYVLNHGRWPHGSDWICEAAIDTYLPLLEALRALNDSNVAAPVTIGFTPVLANQLASPTFHRELELYFDQRLQACADAPAELAATGDRHLVPLAHYWDTRLRRLRRLFHDVDRDLVAAFRRLEEAGRLEIMGSAATHGFLPLLAHDESIRLQLALGRSEHHRLFGRYPAGCWVPECAYRPREVWAPLPNAPNRGLRRGIEEHLADAGFQYFFADSHMARAGSPLGLYGEPVGHEIERWPSPPHSAATRHSPYRTYRLTGKDAARPVSTLVRDPRSSAQVWSRQMGYPGHAAYLEFHKIRWPGGLRFWRVSEPGTDLGAKSPYVPDQALAQASRHAAHFSELLGGIAARSPGGRADVVVAPFDTELFGHWWFEGVDFLAHMFRSLAGEPRVRPTTASVHLRERPPRSGLRLAKGSWGAEGDYSMWLNPKTAWMWPKLWAMETAFWELAPAALAEPGARPALAQAARELLLLQSSDWQFIISTGEVTDYALERFTRHGLDTEHLLALLREGLAGGDLAAAGRLADELHERDDLFPDMLPAIEASLGGRATAR